MTTPHLVYGLLADGGSTKTDWALMADGQCVLQCQTEGINPFHQSPEAIAAVLHEQLLPQLPAEATVGWVAFYGSGVRPELQYQMCRLLGEAFPDAEVEAESDLLGAARAVCGRSKGVACILGTGSNSGLYDGTMIVENTPPLGYILGDEGSGAVLGKRLLHLLFKDPSQKTLREAFLKEKNMTLADVIDRVYRQPLANRWLASLSPFVAAHLSDRAMSEMVIAHFREFFRYNVAPYHCQELPVGFVGSMAYYYRRELETAARLEGFTVGEVYKCPLQGLIAYHGDATER